MYLKLKDFMRANRSFMVFMLLMIGFRSAIADWNVVPSGSMQPTIVAGDRITVNKLAYDIRIPLIGISVYKLADPQRNDIVVFESARAGKRMVKRIIGLPGKTIAMQDGRLIIDGKPLVYTRLGKDDKASYLREQFANCAHRIRWLHQAANAYRNFPPARVPAGHYLVLGDNRDNSADSRVYGFIPREEIIGRSSRVVLSLDYDNNYLPRTQRFWQRL